MFQKFRRLIYIVAMVAMLLGAVCVTAFAQTLGSVTVYVEHTDFAGHVFRVPDGSGSKDARYMTKYSFEGELTVTGENSLRELVKPITGRQLYEVYGVEVEPVPVAYRLIDHTAGTASVTRRIPNGETSRISCVLTQGHDVTLQIMYQYAYDVTVHYAIEDENGAVFPLEDRTSIGSATMGSYNATELFGDSMTVSGALMSNGLQTLENQLVVDGVPYSYADTLIDRGSNGNVTLTAQDSEVVVTRLYRRTTVPTIVVMHTDMAGNEFCMENYQFVQNYHETMGDLSPVMVHSGTPVSMTFTSASALTGSAPLTDGMSWSAVKPAGMTLVLQQILVYYPETKITQRYDPNETVPVSVSSDNKLAVVTYQYGYRFTFTMAYVDEDGNAIRYDDVKTTTYVSSLSARLFSEEITYYYTYPEELNSGEYTFLWVSGRTENVSAVGRNLTVKLSPLDSNGRVIAVYAGGRTNPFALETVLQQHVLADRTEATTTMKSGYSLYTTVRTGPRVSAVYAYVHGFTLGSYTMQPKLIRLEDWKTDGATGTIWWHFPENPKYRTITVPVDFPDGCDFVVEFFAFDRFGILRTRSTETVRIDGNMYSDDFTSKGH